MSAVATLSGGQRRHIYAQAGESAFTGYDQSILGTIVEGEEGADLSTSDDLTELGSILNVQQLNCTPIAAAGKQHSPIGKRYKRQSCDGIAATAHWPPGAGFGARIPHLHYPVLRSTGDRRGTVLPTAPKALS
jgi:hypothetical protein